MSDSNTIWRDTLDNIKQTYLTRYFPEIARLLNSNPDRTTRPALLSDLSALIVSNVTILNTIERNLPSSLSLATARICSEVIDPYLLETSIRTAAVILERAATDRVTWQRLHSDCFKIALDLVEFLILDDITWQEEQAGSHQQSKLDSNAEATALNTLSVNFSATLEGWRNVHAINYADGPKQDSMLRARNVVACPISQTPQAYVHVGLEGCPPNMALIDWARDVAKTEREVELNRERDLLTAQYHQLEAEKLAAEDRRTRAYARRDFQTIQGQLNASRSQAARALAKVRARAFSEKGGALNLLEQMAVLEARYANDYAVAAHYAQAIRFGMRDVFDAEVGDPPEDLDDLVSWLRSCANLVDFEVQQESFLPIRVSVRAKAGEDQFSSSSSWQVLIDADDYPGLSRSRLKAIDAFVETAGDPRSYRLKVTPPTPMKSMTIGCAMPAQWQRTQPIQVSGWLNRGPAGKWSCELQPPVQQGEVQDVILNLWVNARQA